MATWLNSDGLYLKWGQAEGVAGVTGEYNETGPLHMVEARVDLVNLTTTATAASILDDFVTIPTNARIEQVVVEAETAATSGGAATLNVGLARTDRSTELDFDGLVTVLAKTAIDAAGEKNTIIVGSTGAGALIGTTLANPGLLVVYAGTAVFTAGRVIIRVYWYRV